MAVTTSGLRVWAAERRQEDGTTATRADEVREDWGVPARGVAAEMTETAGVVDDEAREPGKGVDKMASGAAMVEGAFGRDARGRSATWAGDDAATKTGAEVLLLAVAGVGVLEVWADDIAVALVG